MTRPARSALVLQGGGALGAYELGATRALYKDNSFAPDVIAGVSIGATHAPQQEHSIQHLAVLRLIKLLRGPAGQANRLAS